MRLEIGKEMKNACDRFFLKLGREKLLKKIYHSNSYCKTVHQTHEPRSEDYVRGIIPNTNEREKNCR